MALNTGREKFHYITPRILPVSDHHLFLSLREMTRSNFVSSIILILNLLELNLTLLRTHSNEKESCHYF